ncbi:MAG: GNAT family N-acetyltransferase [Fibrobacter sp.]|nr:GNAT family N-acetyltransferase [Fibrobacter sp.]
MKLKIDELNTSQFETLEEEWSELCRQSIVTPFQFPQWLIPWWHHFGGGILKAVTFRYNGELIGFAPLFIYSDNNNVRKLCLIGSGISDYLDIIIRHNNENSVLPSFFSYLHDIKDQWDECNFHDIAEESHLLHCLYPQWLRVKIEEFNICPYIDRAEKNDLSNIIPKKLRKNISHASRELKKKGCCTFEAATDGSRLVFLDDLFSLHRARWMKKNKTGVLNNDTLLSFHRCASERLCKDNLFKIYSLKLNDKIIAAYYTLYYKKCIYIYIGGFDPKMEKFSPGTLALYHVIEDAFNQGIEVFDFLRGDEFYKSLWGPFYRYNYRIRMVCR